MTSLNPYGSITNIDIFPVPPDLYVLLDALLLPLPLCLSDERLSVKYSYLWYRSRKYFDLYDTTDYSALF